MKKLFTEPDLEILTFLCNDTSGADSVTIPGEEEGGPGILPGIGNN